MADKKKRDTSKMLNKRKEDVYNYIVEYTIAHNFPPSVREICEGAGLKSTSSVHMYLMQLEMEGLISTMERQPRTIDIKGYHFVKDEKK